MTNNFVPLISCYDLLIDHKRQMLSMLAGFNQTSADYPKLLLCSVGRKCLSLTQSKCTSKWVYLFKFFSLPGFSYKVSYKRYVHLALKMLPLLLFLHLLMPLWEMSQRSLFLVMYWDDDSLCFSVSRFISPGSQSVSVVMKNVLFNSYFLLHVELAMALQSVIFLKCTLLSTCDQGLPIYPISRNLTRKVLEE